MPAIRGSVIGSLNEYLDLSYKIKKPRGRNHFQAHCTRGKMFSDQNSRPCLTHDSVSYGSTAACASGASITGIFVIGTCADCAPCKLGADLFVSSNHEMNPRAPNTARNSIERTVQTKGMRV